MKTIAATVVVSTLLVLALGPMQLQGLPGHLRTHDGVMADNQETERAVIEALLTMARSQNEATANQRPQVTIEGHRQRSDGNARQQNKTAMIQQIWSEMARKQQIYTRNQQILNRRRQQAESQQVAEQFPIYAEQYTGAQQYADTEKAIVQQSGVTIEYCGAAGDIIQNALRFGLSFIPGGDAFYGVYIACAEQPTYPCTTVTVAVPANSIKADIDVCDYGKLLNNTCTKYC